MLPTPIVSERELIEFYRLVDEVVKVYLLIPKSIEPLNYLEEKQKFFSKKKYNIQLQYRLKPWNDDQFQQRYDEIETDLSAAQLPSDLSDYVYELIASVKKYYSQATAIGTEEFAQSTAQLYSQKPLTEEYRQWINGESLLKLVPFDETGETYNAEQIKDRFAEFLKAEGILDECELFIDADHSPETIRIRGRKVVIGSHMQKTEIELQRLIVHELKTHVRRNIEGRHHKLATLRKLVTPSQSETEEGLAVFNEITSGCITEFALKRYGLRALGITNLNLSFHELYELAREYLSEDESFLFAYRLKRGLPNTAVSGGYARDLIYFNGYVKVMQFTQNGGNIDDLYIGKLCIEDIPLVKKYNL